MYNPFLLDLNNGCGFTLSFASVQQCLVKKKRLTCCLLDTLCWCYIFIYTVQGWSHLFYC